MLSDLLIGEAEGTAHAEPFQDLGLLLGAAYPLGRRGQVEVDGCEYMLTGTSAGDTSQGVSVLQGEGISGLQEAME